MITSKFHANVYYFLIAAAAASFLISLFLLQLFVALISILWLFESIENKKKSLDIFTWLIAGFGIIRILSIIFSQYPGVSVQSFYKDALFYFGFFSFSYYLKVIDYGKLKSILNYFSLAAIVVALIGVVLFNLSYVDRAQSFSSGYSTFSSYLIVGLGVMIAVPPRIKMKNFDILIPLGTALVISGIITSLGRTNMLIAGLLFLTGVVMKKIEIKNIIIVAALTVIICGLSFYNNTSQVEQRVENPTALSDRGVLMKGFEKLKFDHPLLGFGPRTFHQIFPYYDELNDKGVGSWHDDFIQVYFESGLLGLAAFLAIIIYVIYFSFKFLREKKKSNYLYDVVLAVMMGFTALVLSAVTAGFIDSPVLSVIFAFLIALLSAANYHLKDVNTE